MKRLLALTLALAGTAGVADAAQYTHHVCRAGGEWAPADGVRFEASQGTSGSDQCAAGGVLSARLTGKTPSSFIEVSYLPPADTSLASISAERYTRNVDSSSNARYELVGTSDVCDGTMGCANLTGAYTYENPLTQAVFRLQCPSGGCLGSAGVNPPELVISSARFVLEDNAAPVITSAPAGGLFSTDRPVQGTETFSFEASDKGGGVYEAELLVDGVQMHRGVVDENAGDCKQPFTRRVPCRLTAAASIPFDTPRLPDGDHALVLNVFDATGQNVATHGPVTVRFANGVPGPPAASAGSTPVAGAKVIGVRPRRDVRTGFAKPVILRGRLIDSAGAPLVNTEVGAYAALDVPGAKPKLVATAKTGPAGGFIITVPPGPSRRIVVRPTNGVDSQAWSLKTRVRAPIALLPSKKRLRNGDKLLLTAYLVGAKVPPKSADVAFQVQIGEQWRTFARRTLDKRGLAQVAHRFKVTFQRMTYRFRVLTLKRKTFPFEDARSRVISVRVN